MDAQPVAEDQVARKESIDGFVVHRPREGNRDDSKLHRKEVIQPQVPLRLPCYDFTPVTSHFLGGYPPLRGWLTDFCSSPLPWCDGRCVQGPGTYSPLPADQGLLAIPTSKSRVADSYPY